MMRPSIGTTGISDEALAAYFDGEATDSEATAIRKAIEGDPELAAELEQLGVMQELTQASLQSAAAEVPQARFEQIWDQIDRAIEQGARLQESANVRAGVWGRLKATLSPLKWPLMAAAAAAAVAVLVLNTGPSPDGSAGESIADRGANKPPQVPSVSPAEDGSARSNPAGKQPAPNQVSDPSRLAQRQPAADEPTRSGQPLAPLPEDSRVEFHEIEGAGNGIRISNGGTVTVLYVEEDVEDEGSERSL